MWKPRNHGLDSWLIKQSQIIVYVYIYIDLTTCVYIYMINIYIYTYDCNSHGHWLEGRLTQGTMLSDFCAQDMTRFVFTMAVVGITASVIIRLVIIRLYPGRWKLGVMLNWPFTHSRKDCVLIYWGLTISIHVCLIHWNSLLFKQSMKLVSLHQCELRRQYLAAFPSESNTFDLWFTIYPVAQL